MKNVLNNTKKRFLMVTMFATLLSFAHEGSFLIAKNDADKISVTLTDVKVGNLLSIKGDNGIVLYKELIKEEGTYTKGFDLTSLPDGEYIFELDKDVEINTIPFSVTSNKVNFNKDLETTIYKPVTRIKGEMVYISRLSLNKSPLAIAVYFTPEDGSAHVPELMYSETIENTENVSRIFRLSGLNKGDYKIIYKTDGKVFTKEITN
ncbi:hypothetical protein [Aestuariibaculum sediminum]|uniref:Uncharacterized protein n=1 Tax=Aestuariibaculum sediminum TaxID=2770637 RepID=A0A8J6PYW7_9FLAO|nr:hypothetical protein [Aestuariibaculum sediminum]MBD0831382.1 hypothetical protein [Aestuariibaculum sediminum]